jgi:predicted PhzF superfamily epimerase YddE/YHI9
MAGMQRRYATTDVFTDRMFGGNPLAVVLDAEGLSICESQLTPGLVGNERDGIG